MNKLRKRINKMLKMDIYNKVYKLKKCDLDNMKEDIKKFNEIYQKYKIFIDEDNGYLKINGENILSNFFISPKFKVIYNKYFEKEEFIYLEVYSIENKEYTAIIIKKEELKSDKWILKYLNLKKYILFDKYTNLITPINILFKNIEKITIANYSGWITKDSGKWQYNSSNSYCHDYDAEMLDSKKNFLESLKFKDIATPQITYPLFSYCLLSIINRLLREIKIEPDFVLMVAGSKESYTMQLVELFAFNINPNRFHKPKLNQSTIGNREYISYSYEPIKNIKDKLMRNKDVPTIIDGIIKSNIMSYNKLDLWSNKLFDNYSKKNSYRIKEMNEIKYYNSLPILVLNKLIKHDLYYSIEVKDVDINKLIEFRKNEYVFTKSILEFIDFIEEWLNYKPKELFNLIKYRYDLYIREIYYNNIDINEREASMCSWILLAYNLYLLFGAYEGYILEENFMTLNNEALNVMINNFIKNKDSQSDFEMTEFEKNKIKEGQELYRVLSIINNIYVNERGKLVTERIALNDGEKGWLVIKNSQDKLLCFNDDDFNNIICENKNIEQDDDFNKNIKRILKEEEIMHTDNDRKSGFSFKINGQQVDKRKIAIKIKEMQMYIEKYNENKSVGNVGNTGNMGNNE